MKKIVVLSGKGGTGKTVFTGSFAVLAENKVMVDADVDAANLHILLHPDIRQKALFKAGVKAKIDEEVCVRCDRCREVCRFDAISADYRVDEFACEGCGACEIVCDADAVRLDESVSGEWFVSETECGFLVHARLHPAEGNSGLLVSEIRKRAESIAQERRLNLILIDGPPGIGCPVIAAVTGVDASLVVTEPTLSGMHDMERVVDLCRRFGVPTFVCVNKSDLNEDNTKAIKEWCGTEGLPFLGEVRFDRTVPESVAAAKPFVAFSDNETAEQIRNIWKKVQALIGGVNGG